MTLRAVTWLFSVALHGALVGVLLISPGGAALDEGSGEDTFVVEQGIALDGFARMGEAEVDIAAVEAPPPVLAAAAPIEEVKPPPPAEDVPHVIGSEFGPEQEDVVLAPEPEELRETPDEVVEQTEPDEIKEIQEIEQVAVIEQTEMSIEEQRATGAKQEGGRATAISAYRGRLYSHISRKKVSPRSQRVGTVIVRFTVGRQGELISSEVTKSSGHQILDDAAIASITRAAPFPPMPSEANDGPLVVSIPFKFSVR